MPKYDNITYPEGGIDILNDSTLGPMFRKFLNNKMADENYRFLDAAARKMDPKKHYPIFFDDRGRYSINVAGPVKQKAAKLAEANNWKPAVWKSLYTESRNTIDLLLQQNFQLEFYKTWPEFRAHHARALRKAIKIPRALKQQLAIEDDSLLAETVVLFMSDRNAGKKAAKALSAKKKTPRSPTEVARAIGKFFKVA